jgi:hypothetical protein
VALRHAGAELAEFPEREDGGRVTAHSTFPRETKDDDSVQVAGICVSGYDQ